MLPSLVPLPLSLPPPSAGYFASLPPSLSMQRQSDPKYLK